MKNKIIGIIIGLRSIENVHNNVYYFKLIFAQYLVKLHIGDADILAPSEGMCFCFGKVTS